MREFEDNDDVRVMLLLQRTSAAGLTLVYLSYHSLLFAVPLLVSASTACPSSVLVYL